MAVYQHRDFFFDLEAWFDPKSARKTKAGREDKPQRRGRR
jgi:hypothetical protein